MIVQAIQVRDYRNAGRKDIILSEGRNAFVGANARGKTNMLEAVYFAGVGKSFRTPRDRELIKNDCPRAYITVVAQKDSGVETVRIVLDREVNKRVAINDVPISRMSELMGVCPVVLFCPDGLKIVKEAPADRRRFMDIALCQVSRTYFAALSRYDKILQSRNKLLKSGTASDMTLAPWDELLSDEGAKIVKSRRGYINKLSSVAAEKHAYLTDGAERLSLEYEGADGGNLEQIKAAIVKQLSHDCDSDLRLKYTHTGPHKDDIGICINGVDVRAFGSQGQQRTVALSMKLAEMQLLTETLGTSPILLLDDVLSEIDGHRRQKLLKALDGFQSIITATEKVDMEKFGVNIIDF
ncbi:MAG: DNA replication/repair protein RecF [Clostridiales bacterium]|nr:DNA replication/repair protein RecF [Clostridiales bacterium]